MIWNLFLNLQCGGTRRRIPWTQRAEKLSAQQTGIIIPSTGIFLDALNLVNRFNIEYINCLYNQNWRKNSRFPPVIKGGFNNLDSCFYKMFLLCNSSERKCQCKLFLCTQLMYKGFMIWLNASIVKNVYDKPGAWTSRKVWFFKQLPPLVLLWIKSAEVEELSD